jgi:enoyl-CoA hydratase
MACDMRIATAQTELGFLQAQLNVTTAWGGGIDLLAALGSARALQLLLEARRIPAAEALQLGLLQRVCAADQSLADCSAAFIAPFMERPTQVLRAFKALALEQRRALHERLVSQEERGFTTTWIHADHWAAAARALAPRSP